MDVSHILDPLNDAQREAVTAQHPHMLIVAGAGSGKTRVLTHRVAWLIQTENISPYAMLAVTFTNKAAAEMRGRIEQLMGTPTSGMWAGTFHGLAHRMLRTHWQEARLPQTFQILDSEDQYRLLRRILKGLELDESKWPPKEAQWYINARKDEGKRPPQCDDHGDFHVRQMIRIYQAYEEACERAGLVDFAELLLRSHDLLKNNQQILQHYQQRFRHILVDEFQDTNTIQYQWIRMLAGSSAQTFMVGDDDQSIYGWRGARIENIYRFEKDFPGAQIVRLEQNYRSTKTILHAANSLIANNTGRLGKNLWTEGADGEPIGLYTAFNELDEANFIVQQIQQWIELGNQRSESAILYRSNAQSRVLEEALIREGIPYRVYGGMRFFERMEIKDALAYLRLIANRRDDASFERVVNTPVRGIGQRTIEELRALAKQENIPLWEAAIQMVNNKMLSARAGNAVLAFLNLIEGMARDTADLQLYEQVEHMLQHSELVTHYKKEKGEKAQSRVENLEELVTATRYFEKSDDDAEMDILSAFLSHASLEAGEGQASEWEDCVQLMTLHSAKGLEFDLVFLGGVEEGLFPHQRSIDEPGRLEEERRLCYVGMTRARKKLFMTNAEVRRLYGSETYTRPSRFISELPAEHIHEIRMRSMVSRPTMASKPVAHAMPSFSGTEISDSGFKLGQRVSHAKFGEGTVVNYEGQGTHARVQVNFERKGSKWLVAAYANLTTA